MIGKTLIGTLISLTIGIIIYFWNQIYWNVIAPMAEEGTLPLLTTALTSLVAVTSAFIAYASYKSGEWKARLEINFGFQSESRFNRLLKTNFIRFRSTDTSTKLVNYIPDTLNQDELITWYRTDRKNDASFPINHDAITMLSLKIRNVGRGELRFSKPLFNFIFREKHIDYIECRKNGVLLPKFPEQLYYELKSGEVMDFYYTLTSITNPLEEHLSFTPLEEYYDELREIWEEYYEYEYGETLPSEQNKDKLNRKIIQAIKNMKQVRLGRVRRLISIFVKNQIIKLRTNNYSPLQPFILDNKGKKVKVPLHRSWVLHSKQMSLDKPKTLQSLSKHSVLKNMTLQLILDVLAKEAFRQKIDIDMKNLTILSIKTLNTLLDNNLLESLEAAKCFVPIEAAYEQNFYDIFMIMALKEYDLDKLYIPQIACDSYKAIALSLLTYNKRRATWDLDGKGFYPNENLPFGWF